MKILNLIMAALLAVLPFTEAKGRLAVVDPILPLIPAPRAWQPAGQEIAVADLVRIVVAVDDQAASRQAELLVGWWHQATGRRIPVQIAGPGEPPAGTIVLRVTGQGPDTAPVVPGAHDETWEMDLTPNGIEIRAPEPAGLFGAMESLRQLALSAGANGTLPCGHVIGGPRFGWRGLLLDSGRHLQDVDFIEDLIDLLALYGFNVLHWHLTEDQGWRLEVPGHQALTDIGAWRNYGDGGRYGGFYTAADIRRVVSHAADRFITVVPEIELPGHAKAALAAYPELSCTGGPFEVETQWGIHEDVFCAGSDAVFALLEDVFDHVVELFPSRYVHIGGDEVPKDRWLACSRCQARITDENLDGVQDLQSWFVGRAARQLADRGRRLVGWDEIIAGGLAEGATVQSWRGTRGAVTAARAGHDAVVSPTSHAYFDYDVGELPLEKVLTFDPVPAELEPEHHHRILGGEMNLWTEYVPQTEIHRQLVPRITAMAEALAAPAGTKDFPGFLRRLHRHEGFWPVLGVMPGPASRPLQIRAEFGTDGGYRLLAHWRDDEDHAARFSGTGLRIQTGLASRPAQWRADVPPEKQPLPAPLEWTSAGFSANTRPPGDILAMARLQSDSDTMVYGAPAVVELHESLALGLPVTLVHEPRERYAGYGSFPLTDGVRGGLRFNDGHWSGFEAVDLDATIDLGSQIVDAEISIRCLQDANAWIFLPTEVRFLGSDDGESWQELGVEDHDVPDTEQRVIIRGFSVRTGRKTRFVRVVATNHGICPDWHPGRGKACWIFVDEVLVRE